MKRYLVFLSVLLLFASCRKGDTGTEPLPTPQADQGVFIINEGAFPGPGTVTFYNITRDSLVGTVVGTSANWTTPNDGVVVGGKLYVVVNGNDKIEILSAENFRSEGSITFSADTDPGFISVVDSQKAFVANYNGTVSEVDLLQKSVVRTSGSVVDFPGGILVVGDKVFVSNAGFFTNPGNKVKVLETGNLSLIDSIRVGRSPGMMARASSGTVYLACAENYSTPGNIYAINPTLRTVFDSVTVGVGPSDIVTSGQSVFVLHSDRIMRLTALPLAVIDSVFVPLSGGIYFYALAQAPANGDLYVSKVTSSGGNGEVAIYSSGGALLHTPFAVGLFPGAFAFK